MEFKKKPQSSVPALKGPQRVSPPVTPVVQRQSEAQRQLQQHTSRPTRVQRQVMQPALRAAELHTQESKRLATEREALQRAAAELGPVSPEAITHALQRQQAPAAVTRVPLKPQSVGDWVTVMRFQAEQTEGRRMQTREAAQLTALQRQVAQTMTRSYLSDRQPALQRQQQYADHVVALQRHPISRQVARAFMLGVPQAERPALQRAVDEAIQRETLQREQHEQALKVHSLQRQLVELEHEATQPVFERIQQRRGSGNPLPEAIQRHLEQGLNHDLSAVRIHDDAEADKLAKKVNAVAFTTGTDIYFQTGKFNPNSQSGLELLAHEATHTVQQSKGQVGKGIDPDAGLESEARAIGRRISQLPLQRPAKRLPRRSTATQTSHASSRLAVQRVGAAGLAPARYSSVLKGPKQQWDDAGAAARLAVQALPGRLAQQFKGIPAQLQSGLLEMLKDTVLILGATTALGAAIGSFFGGVGAIPGAEIGYEIGNGVLMAWGLASVVAALAQQSGKLVQSMQSYLTHVKHAKGDQKEIKIASEALVGGLVLFADGLILAIAALGLKKLANTRIGKQIGATSANSPTMKWLAERQKMASTQAALAKATSRGGQGGTPPGMTPALATANARAGNQPRVTPERPQPRMDMSSASTGASAGGRVRAPVKGLYEGIDIANPPQGWKFKQELTSGANGKNLKILVTAPNGKTGIFERAYDPANHQLIMKNAFGNELPKWMNTPGPEMVAGKGIPTNAFMTMFEMRRMGIAYGSLKTVKMSTIQNMQAVLELETLRRKGMPLDEAILHTHSVQYAESSLIQSGHEVVGAKVITTNEAEIAEIGGYMAHYERRDPKLAAEHNRLLQQFGMSRTDKMLINYDIVLTLKPLAPGVEAKPLVK